MITKIIEVTQPVENDDWIDTYKDKKLNEFVQKVRIENPLITRVAEFQGLDTSVIMMDNTYYVWQSYSSFGDFEGNFSDEEHVIWKCETLDDLVKQLVVLKIFEYTEAVKFIFEGIEERKMWVSPLIIQSRIPINSNTPEHQLNLIEEELKRKLRFVEEAKGRKRKLS